MKYRNYNELSHKFRSTFYSPNHTLKYNERYFIDQEEKAEQKLSTITASKNFKTKTNFFTHKRNISEPTNLYSSLSNMEEKIPFANIDKSRKIFIKQLFDENFYPRILKKSNFRKHAKNFLPSLTNTNFHDVFPHSTRNKLEDDNMLSSNNNFHADPAEEKIPHFSDYSNSMKQMKNLYNMNIKDNSPNKMLKSNKLNREELLYIKNTMKDNNQKDLEIKVKNSDFDNPKKSLKVLKLNRLLVDNINEACTKMQYETYINSFNSQQKEKYKLYIMPKATVRTMKLGFKGSGTNKSSKKHIFGRHSPIKARKSEEDATEADEEKLSHINKKSNQITPDLRTEQSIINTINTNYKKENVVSSTVIRNYLLKELNSYFFRYFNQSKMNPSSRIYGTLTAYNNSLFLFGGLNSTENSELWKMNLKKNNLCWEKINFKIDSNFNRKYGHTTCLFNDLLYIFGGNINLKKTKYPYEDLMIYNIKTNTMKVSAFNACRNKYSRQYIYIPKRRNHIAHVIGNIMIVQGGIDLEKEYFGSVPDDDELFKPLPKNNNHLLGDFMFLDLNSLKWTPMTKIFFKTRDKKVNETRSCKRVYHSSCLVLSQINILKVDKLNIFKSDKVEKYPDEQEGNKKEINPTLEGIYIFGGLDEHFKPTNNLYVLHCFRNPLIFTEPRISGKYPSPRFSCSMDYNATLSFIVIFGGKDITNVFNDFFVLDLINFCWINVDLFGTLNPERRSGHCSAVVDNSLYIFGGYDENNTYINAKTMCVDLDILKNKKLKKIYDYAVSTLKSNHRDRGAHKILECLEEGKDLPPEIISFLHLDLEA